jgi:hypothetical protein
MPKKQMSAYTPGPYGHGPVTNVLDGRAQESFKCEVFATSTLSPVAGKVRYFRAYGKDYDECEANAELIVGAPALWERLAECVAALEAINARLLKGVVEVQPNFMEQDCHRIINTALAKANSI